MNSFRIFPAVFLLVCQAGRLLAGEPGPVDVVQRFQLALELKDEALIRRCALPDPDLPVLWDGEKPKVEQLVGISLSLGEVKVQEIGREEQGGEEVARVQRTIRGRQEPALMVRRTGDGWRIDARPFVRMALQRVGRSPAGSAAAAWKNVFVLEEFLQNGSAIWTARLDVLRQTPQGRRFEIAAGEATRAVCGGGADDARPTLFGRPLQGLELSFRAGRLAEVVAVLYDADGSGAAVPPAQVQGVLKEIDRALRKLARSSGRFRQKRPDPGNKARVVRAREWRLPGTLLRLEAVAAKQSATNPGAGAGGAGEVTAAIRVRATPRSEASRDERRRPNSTERKVGEILASLGTDVSPGEDEFWEQSTLGFLGTLTAASYAHWTAEQETEGVARYRSTYMRRPQREVRDSKPVLFVRNEPLSASRLMLFGKPVVAMVASFRDDRLVAFRFDFWNKGDGAPGVGEEVGERAVEDVLGRLRQAGLEFQRRAGSHGRISRVRDVRYAAKSGPTAITFIVEKGEYYSLLLEAFAEAADPDDDEKERVSGRELRTAARGQVIRVSTEKEAAEHPGVVRAGDVFVEVPMVDQGPKGYCAPATLTRVVQYYGNQTTMNEMAAMMATEEGGGTRLSDIRDSVRKVTRRLHMSFREEEAPDRGRLDSERRVDRWVRKAVVEYIDSGNPIFWTVPQHIRLIVGYNASTREVLYSDSWGRKGYDRVSYRDAASMTEAVWIIR